MSVKLKEREISCLNLFRHLTTDELTLFTPLLRRCSFPVGKTIITMGQSGSGVYLLLEGAVKICTQQQGSDETREVILNICGVGEILGEIDAMTGRGHSASVITASPSQFLWISTEDFRTCLYLQPKLSRSLNDTLAERLQRLSARESAHALLSLEGRLARQLLLLGRDHGIRNSEGIMIPVRLPQRDLASLVGSTRERVNQTISKFKKRGLVETDPNGMLVLCQHSILGEYCNGCADSSQLLQDVAMLSTKRSPTALKRSIMPVKIALRNA